ncbi:MAG: RagB/SusD family nutrient uptake outer membrane protein [Bacteroidota bacterium]
MKLKNIIMIALMPVAMMASCKKELELKDPQGLDPETALSNDANIKKVLQGGYNDLSAGSLYGGDIQLLGDLLGSDGELTWVGTFNNYREIWGKNIITTNSLVSGMWISAYSAINIANNVLANIDKVADADKARVEGEALFIRAAMHFELVRFFAKDYTDGSPATNPGVPVITTPTNSTNDITRPTRNSVAEVYAAVIADLTKAISLLPATNTVYATKAVAGTILSRVYLQKADYAMAAATASDAITAATGKALLPTFMANFNQSANTGEDLFTIQVSDQDGVNGLHTYYSVDIFGGRDGDIEVNDTHLDLYQTGDLRKAFTTNPGVNTSFNTPFYTKYGAFRTTKWKEIYKNPKVARLAELYLTRAEANFRMGTAVGATPLSDVNRVHSGARTGLAELAAITLDDIYLERRRELAFEGFGIHDAKRFKRTIDGLAWNSDELVLPIPFRELNANSSLTQNPGYN